jgi:hypothetical protein
VIPRDIKIVCLGWGSLIWDPGDLSIDHSEPPETGWLVDGPFLPVEFARQSGGDRITLVLVLGRRSVPVLWTPMLVESLENAKRSLALRECRQPDGQQPSPKVLERFVSEYCGYWSDEESKGSCSDTVGQWAAARNLDAVVWTDFPARFEGVSGQIPTGTEVVNFLRTLSGEVREEAMKYVCKTPRQIRTDYRAQIETELGWKPTSIV